LWHKIISTQKSKPPHPPKKSSSTNILLKDPLSVEGRLKQWRIQGGGKGGNFPPPLPKKGKREKRKERRGEKMKGRKKGSRNKGTRGGDNYCG